MTIRDIPRFGERLRMIEEAWLREEGRALPVPALYGQGFTLGIVAGVEWASEQADREPSETEELARLRLERLEAVEDFITRHYLDTQMGERVLAIVNGIEEVRRADNS